MPTLGLGHVKLSWVDLTSCRLGPRSIWVGVGWRSIELG